MNTFNYNNYSLGQTKSSLILYQASYIPPVFSIFYKHSEIWKSFREFYHPSNHQSYKTWYFTIATQKNEKLENLLLSAHIAGVEIEVVITL